MCRRGSDGVLRNHAGQGAPNVGYRAFFAWLKKQRHRDDRVGDLARDWCVDVADRCAQTRTLSGMDRHLRDVHSAGDEVLESRDVAYREFAGHPPKEKA